MNRSFQRRIIHASRLAYTLCLLVYPCDLRRRFGAEMVEVFEDVTREALTRSGPKGMAMIWRSAVWELLTLAAASRLASNTVMAGALSFLAASALFLVFFQFVR